MNDKVVYLGLGKAWTTSFGTACEILGYKVYENDYGLLQDINNGKYDKVWQLIEKYDVFEDYPWPFLWKEIDEKYDNFKYVLGTRPTQKWMKSVIYHSLRPQNLEHRRQLELRHQSIFKDRVNGYDKYLPLHTKELMEMYDMRNKQIYEYFEGRDDFLKWDIKDGWRPICDFLGKEEPDLPFPYRKNAYPYPNYDRLLKMAINNPERYYGW